jgi:EPS I polysaccharide export inner membrane protein EpsE
MKIKVFEKGGLAADVVWAFAASFINRIASLSGAILIARLVGKEGFGEIAVVQNAVAGLSVLTGLGISAAATKYVAEFKFTDKKRLADVSSIATCIAGISGMAGGIALGLFSGWFSKSILENPTLATPLMLTAPSLALNTVVATQNAIIAGYQGFRGLTLIALQTSLIGVPLSLALSMQYGVPGYIVSTVVASGLNFYLCRRQIRYLEQVNEVPKTQIVDAVKEIRMLLRNATPNLLSGLLVVPVMWACTIVVTRGDNGLVEMANFNAANQWFVAILFIPGAVGQALLPALTIRLIANGKSEARRLLIKGVSINVILAAPASILLIICSQTVVGLYGADFKAAEKTLQIVALTTIFAAAQAPVGQIIVAKGRMWQALVLNTIWAITFVGVTLVPVQAGSEELAFARLLSYILHCILTTWYASSLLTSKNAQ